jgi:hypothetical protein
MTPSFMDNGIGGASRAGPLLADWICYRCLGHDTDVQELVPTAGKMHDKRKGRGMGKGGIGNWTLKIEHWGQGGEGCGENEQSSVIRAEGWRTRG